MKIKTLKVIFLLFITFFLFSSESKAVEHCKMLIEEAQVVFDDGYDLYIQGHNEMAIQAFKRSHSILVQASSQSDISLQSRINSIFKIYYDKLSQFEPKLSEELKLVRLLGNAKFKDPEHEVKVRTYILRLLEKNKKFLENGFSKSQKYLSMIRAEFSSHGIPLELAYMALIESGFNPKALSPAKARGMWQFIPSTARHYGLEVSDKLDERLDPVKSTKAAAQYLVKLYDQFENWPLALAAYNCGEGRVAKELKKHDAKTFWELLEYKALPNETQQYVLNIIAVAIISRDLNIHGIAIKE